LKKAGALTSAATTATLSEEVKSCQSQQRGKTTTDLSGSREIKEPDIFSFIQKLHSIVSFHIMQIYCYLYG
jgi:hypothetical protein